MRRRSGAQGHGFDHSGDERVCVGEGGALPLFVPPSRTAWFRFPTRFPHRLAHAGVLPRNSRRQPSVY